VRQGPCHDPVCRSLGPLRYPVKRTGKRGEGKWQRITWIEAFDLIEEKMNKIKEEHGPECMIIWGYNIHATPASCSGKAT